MLYRDNGASVDPLGITSGGNSSGSIFTNWRLACPSTGVDNCPSSTNDLFFVKTVNTGSGHVEVHSATAASGYQSGQHSVTWLSPGDAGNGWFQMVGADLYFIKTRNTGSGHVEVHSATSASGYQSGQHSVTWLSPGDAGNGWFQMGRKG